MTTKTKMLELIKQVKDSDTDFLMNDCCGTDLLMDVVNNYLERLNKKELERLYERALDKVR